MSRPRRAVGRLAKLVLLVLALMFSTVSLAGAVTDGYKDGNGHPYVVLLLMDVGGAPAYRCTGTLLSPTVLLTAGHCTSNEPDVPYSGMRIFTQSDLTQGGNTYPYGSGPNSVEAKAWYTLTGDAWFDEPFYMNDAGIVILKSPGYRVPGGVYGALPEVDQFDAFATERGLEDVFFTSVGYGMQASYPPAAGWKRTASGFLSGVRRIGHFSPPSPSRSPALTFSSTTVGIRWTSKSPPLNASTPMSRRGACIFVKIP